MPIQRLTKPDHTFINMLGDNLSEHAKQQLGTAGFRGVGVRAIDEDGKVFGGIHAWVNWNWLQIYLVWLDESARGKGLGTAMLKEIESMGRERGCEYAHLDTFSFQAPGFYERQGYLEFGRLNDYPPGNSRHYYRKKLA